MNASSESPLQVGTLGIEVHVDYAVLAPAQPPESPPPLVVTLHGWGQSCRGFGRRMAPLAEPGFLVLVPQAPNQLYVSMDPKKVGFSWLTQYERDRSIDDFVRYMTRLLAHVKQQHAYDPDRVFLLGFSQGVSMAYRFAASQAVRPAGLVAWASDLPPDVQEKLPGIAPFPVLLVHAPDDPVVTVDKSDAAAPILESHGFPVERMAYEGGHTLPSEVVRNVGAWLRERAAPYPHHL